MISLLQILPRAQKWHITIIRRLELAAWKRPARIFKMLKQSCKSQQNNTGRAAPRCFSCYITEFWPLPHRWLFPMLLLFRLPGAVYQRPLGAGFFAVKSVRLPCSGFAMEVDWKSLGFSFRTESGANNKPPTLNALFVSPTVAFLPVWHHPL